MLRGRQRVTSDAHHSKTVARSIYAPGLCNVGMMIQPLNSRTGGPAVSWESVIEFLDISQCRSLLDELLSPPTISTTSK